MVNRIVALIKQKGLSISAVEKQLGFGNGAIKRFSTSSPSADKVIILSNFLNVSADYLLTGKEKSPSTDLTADEQELLTYYKKLDLINKGKVIGRAETLVAICSEKQAALEPVISESTAKKIYIELYDLPVSAGTGVYLNNCDKNMLEVNSTPLTEEANFALEVRGDSMAPKFSDGDFILIRTQPCVEIDEIGIFILNDEGYVKKFGGDRLISLNSDYDDILIHEYDDICCKGRVLGVLPDDCVVE